MRKNIYTQCLMAVLGLGMASLTLSSCHGGKTQMAAEAGDTVRMKYAKLLTIVRHGEGYTEVKLANPWKKGQDLHRYLLIPKGAEGDKVVEQLKSNKGDIVRTPLEKNVVFTSPHCQLMYELGCQKAIAGVCDLPYINIKDVKERVGHQNIADCGSGMQPNIERIISVRPSALFISPFENSGDYGKLDKLHIPIIETVDYMEASPLGRAEWMRFYGMLFGNGTKDGNEMGGLKISEASSTYASCEQRADSLFAAVEREYLWLKKEAGKLPKGLSVLTERKTGNVWYVPGGASTIGVMLKDANARYIYEEDTHSGSLALSPEQILSRGKDIDVWAFKYFEPNPLTREQLLQEYEGYKVLGCFASGNIYECNTSVQPYFEMTSFHPELLLRDLIIISHPAGDNRFSKYSNGIKRLGKLRFYQPIDATHSGKNATKAHNGK